MKKIKRHIAVKSITGMVLLLVVFSAVVGIIGYRSFTNALLEQYSDGAFITARAAEKIVNGSRIEEYVETEGTTEEYAETWRELDALCNSSGSMFIYVIQADRVDYSKITFIFSTMNRESEYTKFDFGYVRDTSNDEYREKYAKLYNGESEEEVVVRDKGSSDTGNHITAMIGLKDRDGNVHGILCVQRQMDELAKVRRTYLTKIFVTFIALALLVTVGQSLYLHYVLLKPLNQISQEADRFSKENVPAEKKLAETIKTRDEIGRLAGSIDAMEEQIKDYVDNMTRITAERERISTELSLATRIQADMLPNIYPPFPDRREFDIYATMDPAKEVGGDFYDFFLVDDDHLCMVMADVSGKGVPAALFMMASKIILANNAMTGNGPAKVLTDANNLICSGNKEDMFVTVWLGILEISTGRLTAANAGHEYPVLKRPGGRYELVKDKHGFVVGGMSGSKYTEYELFLEPGSKLFLYTDGVPEATDAEGKMFGTERMLAALDSGDSDSPVEVLKTVRGAVDGFVKGAEQFDDITMLCCEYKGNVE
ncbi:MAG: SpoIIE family protein phosphatase [Clostridia bacterium]|nr:SpoIIE family protein phosphatase [Clostridia bacterium]